MNFFHKIKNDSLKLILIIVVFYMHTIPLFSTEYSHCGRITIDGYFDDWENIESIDDPVSDSNDKLDLVKIKLSQDDNYIFLYFQFTSEINIQENNQVKLFIDSDNNINTGDSFRGIGADLIWNFGDRSGSIIMNSKTYNIRHSILDLCGLPSVTSKEFEFAISKNTEYIGQKVFPTSKINIIFITDFSGDYFPDNLSEKVTIAFTQCDQIPIIPIKIEKEESDNLRLLSWNCLQDNLAKSNLTNIFSRLIQTANPDIIAFQELYETDEDFIDNFIKSTFPGEKRYIKKQAFTDIVLVSKFPIISSYQLDGNSAFLVDLKEKYRTEALFINVHFPASQENTKRLSEITKIIEFIRSIKNNSAQIKVNKNTPIFIVGDMNLVGFSEQLNMLLTGNISGMNADLDWDNSELKEANPRLTESPFCYTWTKSTSSFWPGKLDFVIFSDYSAKLIKSFSINTMKMSAENIIKYSLNKDDSPSASDHLPIIADFEIVDFNSITPKETGDFIKENPTDNSFTNLSDFHLSYRVFDLLGNIVQFGDLLPGDKLFVNQSFSGIYFIQFLFADYNFKPIIKRLCNSGLPVVISPTLNNVPNANQNSLLP